MLRLIASHSLPIGTIKCHKAKRKVCRQSQLLALSGEVLYGPDKTGYNNFFLNNQPDALIIPILFCYKTLHVSGIFSAHHQEFSTVHSALVSFMQVSDDHLEAVTRYLHETYQC